jgi:hypothetical protein
MDAVRMNEMKPLGVGLILTAALLCSVSIATAASGQTARAFTVQVWALNSDARYADQWALMHPAQQRVLKRGTFVTCFRKAYGPPRDDNVSALDTRTASVAVSGTGLRTPGVAVTFVLVSSAGKTYGPYVQNVVRVNGVWRWVMRGDDFQACPKLAAKPG